MNLKDGDRALVALDHDQLVEALVLSAEAHHSMFSDEWTAMMRITQGGHPMCGIEGEVAFRDIRPLEVTG